MIPVDSKLEADFITLKDKWEKETYFVSSVSQMIGNSNYQSIIAMGEPVLPLLFNEMLNNKGHWFHAVQKITGQQIIPESMYGRIRQMNEVWVNWAKENGYLSKDFEKELK